MNSQEASFILQQTTHFPSTDVTTARLLEERGSRYGSFAENSSYAERFMEIISEAQDVRGKSGRPLLTSSQANALVMISQKMSRILSAPDATYADNWDDIGGYAELGKTGK